MVLWEEREREREMFQRCPNESQVLRDCECCHAEHVLVGNLESNYESLQSKATIMLAQCAIK